MNKKIITFIMAATVLSSTSVFADEIVSPINETENSIINITDVFNTPKFTKEEVSVVSVSNDIVKVKSENKETDINTSEDATVVNTEGEVKAFADIKENDNLFIYTLNGNVKVVVIVNDDAVNADVDTYLKSEVFGVVTNAANTLALNIDENSDIVDVKGEKVNYTDLEGKLLIVLYKQVAMSIPGQTNPEKIIVLEEAELKPTFVRADVTAVKVDGTAVTVKSDNNEETISDLSTTTVFDAKGEKKTVSDIKENDKLCVFSKDGKVVVTVIADTEGMSVDVDKYINKDDTLVNNANTLAINVDENSDIVDLDGAKVSASELDGKEIVVIYDKSTRSIPAQTTPVKVIVITETSKKDVNKLTVNGEEIAAIKFDDEKSTFMVPVRAVAEKLGYTLDWDGGELKVTVNSTDDKVEFKIGVNDYVSKRKDICKLESAPELIDDVTYVPYGMFETLLGTNVSIEGNNLNINK